MSEDDDNGLAVCAMDSEEKARDVAAYFGGDGIILEIDVPKEIAEYHPDYGHGPEFDTIHIRDNVAPSQIIRMIHAPNDRPPELTRPTGKKLRTWKSEQTTKDPDFHKKLAQYNPQNIADHMRDEQ